MSTVEVVKMTGLLDLSVSQLTFDSDVQCRESIQMGTVTEYKEALSANVVFPPLVVFHDGTVYWVADGFHRGSAYRESGATKCPCDVRSGTKRDAILYAVGANTGHGLRRLPADKRRAVMTLLNDSEWRGWSDREIAKRVGVTHPFVASLRPHLETLPDAATAEPRKAIRNGKEYTMDTSNIGETKPVEKVEAVEEAEDEEEMKPDLERRQRIVDLLKSGAKVADIMKVEGCAESYVRYLKKNLSDGLPIDALLPKANRKPKIKESVGLVGSLLTETDIEPETETAPTPEPAEKKTSDGAPLLKQAKICSYAWEVALRTDWIIDPEHVDSIVKELNQLRLLTTQVIKKVKGT